MKPSDREWALILDALKTSISQQQAAINVARNLFRKKEAEKALSLLHQYRRLREQIIDNLNAERKASEPCEIKTPQPMPGKRR